MTRSNTPEISVCICTYKRPDLLLQLLESLARQTLPAARFEAIVVDNDALASARQTILLAAQRYPALVVRYEIEPVQGISYARNKVVALATASLLAFIDDDEWPPDHWLSDLLDSMTTLQADAVLGPVIPQYPVGTRAWVIKSRIFERPRFATGTLMESNSCRLSNALVNATLAKSRQPVPFSGRLAHTGGEDFEFFRWLEAQGATFMWCDTAAVNELVPPGRQTLAYMLSRGLRTSATYWQIVNRNRSKPRIVAEAALGVAIGISFALWGLCLLPVGLHRTARSWVTSAKGFGRTIALANISIAGY